MQEFCQSGDAFGNASRFRDGLDFGQLPLRAAVTKPGVARAVWRFRKMQRVTLRRAVQEFCQSGLAFGNASLFHDFLSRTSVHECRNERLGSAERTRSGARSL